MADNTQLNSGSGGDTIATDDIGGVKHQRVKVGFGNDGSYTDVSQGSPLPMLLADGPHADAFSRMRVSDPVTVFESKLLTADKAPLLWDEQLESGGGVTGSTPTTAKPYIDFQSTLNTAAVYTRQSFQRLQYQPGKGQLVIMTGVLDLSGGGAGVQRRVGYFDDNNGLFFEDNAGTVNVVVRSNDTGTPIDTKVAQASWNIDPMDGTGPSGLTVDWTNAQIFMIDFQWLSVGRIRFSVDIDGVICLVHEVLQANNSAIPYMSTPNLPLRYQMITTASSPASSMRVICTAVITEGGRDANNIPFSHATSAKVDADVVDEIYAICAIRLRTGFFCASVDLESISMITETSDNFEWQLRWNPTVAGTFTYSTIDTNSSMEGAVGATANTVTGGVIMDRGFGSAGAATGAPSPNHGLRLGAAIDGTQDEIVLCARPLGASADIEGAINWGEQH